LAKLKGALTLGHMAPCPTIPDGPDGRRGHAVPIRQDGDRLGAGEDGPHLGITELCQGMIFTGTNGHNAALADGVHHVLALRPAPKMAWIPAFAPIAFMTNVEPARINAKVKAEGVAMRTGPFPCNTARHIPISGRT
jgi:hypothetical protein